VGLGERQSRVVQEQSPARRWVRVLGRLVFQGKVQLLDKAHELPKPQLDPGERPADAIGWADEDWWYLLPDAAPAPVVKVCRETGEPFVADAGRVAEELVELGVAKRDTKHNTIMAKVGGGSKRVLKLRRAEIDRLLHEPGAESPS